MYNRARIGRARIGASVMVLSYIFMAWMFAQNVAAAPVRQGATITSPAAAATNRAPAAAAAGVSVAEADTATPTHTPAAGVGSGATPTPTPVAGVDCGEGGGITSTFCLEVLPYQWVLESFNTEAKTAGQDVKSYNITINFAANGSLSGSGGCNDYFGSYTVAGQQMTISKLGSTQKACEQAVMDRETQYLQQLSTVNAYSLNQSKLELSYANGKNTMTFIRGGGMPKTGSGSSGWLLGGALAFGLMLLTVGVVLGLRLSGVSARE